VGEREETRGRIKNLKVCLITKVCTYAKRILTPSCPVPQPVLM